MAGDPAAKKGVTPEEYLAAERVATEKHFLWNGEVFAKARASMDHNRVVRNVVALLHGQLRGKPCEPFPSDLRVWVPAKVGYVYPDASVACAPIELQDREKMDVLMNPRVVVEVLSDTTEAFDRGEKFDGYKSVASLEEYVIVATNRRHVDSFRRQADGSWVLRSYEGTDEVPLESIACRLALDDVYDRTESEG